MPSSLTSFLPAAAALAAVLALVLLAGRISRLTGFARPGLRLGPSRRLAIRDSLQLDRTRRLQIVRCDNRDVLLLTGGPTDVVVGWIPIPPSASPEGAAP